MPQNPTNITDSPGFKDFIKANNLEVFNQESINIALYHLWRWTMEVDEENKQLREMIMEIAKNININKLHPEVEWCHPKYDGTETLFDKWNNKWTSDN